MKRFVYNFFVQNKRYLLYLKESILKKRSQNTYFFIAVALFFFMGLSFFSSAFPLWKLDLLPSYNFFGFLLIIIAIKSVTDKKNLFINFVKTTFINNVKIFLIIFPIHLIIHYYDFIHKFYRLHPDNNLPNLVTKTILQEGVKQIYWFSQTYQGVLQSYIYSLFTFVFRDLTIAVVFANSLMFSLAVLVFSKLFYKILDYNWGIILAMLTPTGVLLYLGSSDAKGYSLIILMMSLILYNSYKYSIEKSNVIYWIGLFSGILFAQYQPSLLFIAGFGVIILIRIFREKKYTDLIIGFAGFITGALPHIMAEVYTGFINFKHIFLENADSSIDKILNLKNFIKFFFYYPASIEKQHLIKTVFLILFCIGFLVYIYKFIKEKNWKYLYIPGIYIYICVFSAFSGRPLSVQRFAMHFHIYVPIVILIIAAAFYIFEQIKWGRYLKYIVITLVVLVSIIRLVDSYSLTNKRHLRVNDHINMISKSNSDILIGDYWFLMRFQYLFDTKIFLTKSMFPGKYFSFPGMSPHSALKCSSSEQTNIDVILKKTYRKKRFETFLKELGVQYDVIESNKVKIYNNITPPLSIDAALYATKYRHKVEKGIIYNNPPWDILENKINIKNRTLIIRCRNSNKITKKYKKYSLKLISSDKKNSLLIPIKIKNREIKFKVPKNMEFQNGDYKGQFYYMGVLIKEVDFHITGQELKGCFSLSYITDRITVFCINNRTSDIENDSKRKKYNFKVKDFNKNIVRKYNHFLGAKKYLIVKGFPLEKKLDIEISSISKKKYIELEIYSLIDFNSMKWGKTIVQKLLIETGTQKLNFDLNPGFNTIKFLIQNDKFSMDSKYRNFFFGVNRNLYHSLYKCGIIVNSIKVLNNKDVKLFSIKPFLRE